MPFATLKFEPRKGGGGEGGGGRGEEEGGWQVNYA